MPKYYCTKNKSDIAYPKVLAVCLLKSCPFLKRLNKTHAKRKR